MNAIGNYTTQPQRGNAHTDSRVRFPTLRRYTTRLRVGASDVLEDRVRGSKDRRGASAQSNSKTMQTSGGQRKCTALPGEMETRLGKRRARDRESERENTAVCGRKKKDGKGQQMRRNMESETGRMTDLATF